MERLLVAAIAALGMLCCPNAGFAHTTGWRSQPSHRADRSVSPYRSHGSFRTGGSALHVARLPREPLQCGDWSGRISYSLAKRSAAARSAFRRCDPCPSTGLLSGACPGYVIDHIIALKRGGADDPVNMQWQSVEEAKAKDKVE